MGTAWSRTTNDHQQRRPQHSEGLEPERYRRSLRLYHRNNADRITIWIGVILAQGTISRQVDDAVDVVTIGNRVGWIVYNIEIYGAVNAIVG